MDSKQERGAVMTENNKDRKMTEQYKPIEGFNVYEISIGLLDRSFERVVYKVFNQRYILLKRG